MSKGSEAVKLWRRNMRARLLTAFGDKCCICGYTRCPANMELHHLDVENKDFNIGDARGDIISWERIVAEVRKCVLVCNRCHGEIHERVAIVPVNALRFDEKFADYRGLAKAELMSPCPVCGKPKPNHKITCSMECKGKRTRVVDWESIDLLALLKSRTRQSLADELGISEAAVRKREKKLLGSARNGNGPSC